ncbi:hypothetical protein Sar04_26890 [Salinispora arenicola]|uniref:Uncharacterized protein n=1 Tax=Salinispora arenicola TaxID=168697 RepID=A0A542XQ97_SALAC|nr:hypothetical protein FB564_3162 [Salinispora arenicola]GIM85953.1 hypothetical protein Sar04_26890 [Salinispora arenicola]
MGSTPTTAPSRDLLERLGINLPPSVDVTECTYDTDAMCGDSSLKMILHLKAHPPSGQAPNGNQHVPTPPPADAPITV